MNKLRYGLLSAAALAAFALTSPLQAQPYGGYGPGWGMMGGYGPGYGPGMMGGYGPGWGGGPGYGHGPGMMGYGYAYAPRGGYGRGGVYRGERLCWTSTDHDRGYGYYAPCRK